MHSNEEYGKRDSELIDWRRKEDAPPLESFGLDCSCLPSYGLTIRACCRRRLRLRLRRGRFLKCLSSGRLIDAWTGLEVSQSRATL